MPKRIATKYDRSPARKKRAVRQRLGMPRGVITMHAPTAPKPYYGRSGDVKWQNGIVNNVEPYVVNFTPGGATYQLNTIQQGTGQNRRIGNSYRNLGIHVRGWIDQGAPAVTEFGTYYLADTLRVALVWDASPNKSLAGYGEIFNVSAATHAGNALPNYTEEDRFQILWQKSYTMQNGKVDAVNKHRYDLDEYIGFPSNLITKMTGGVTGGDYTVMNTGALLLCIGGSLGTAFTTSFSELYMHHKLFFDEKTH